MREDAFRHWQPDAMTVRHQFPTVTPNDVARIARRDFPEEQFDSVMAVLNGYESKRERSRVRLATLKLANGDLNALRKQIATAREDFRDVLAPAEYPEYSRLDVLLRTVPTEENQRILDSDWRQYEAWLKR